MKWFWVACLLVALCCDLSVQAGYDCSPDGSVIVSGLPADVDSVFAINKHGLICNTSSVVDNAVIITGCPKETSIVFSYGSYDGMASNLIQGGRNITIVNVTCLEITDTRLNISNTLETNLTIGSVQDLSVMYNVTSSLSQSSAVVGDSITMTIEYPENYFLEVSNCTANPGTTYNSTKAVPLISDYCSQENELISDFTGANGTVSATILAFKFVGNDDVFLQCRVKVCPLDDGSCTTSCSIVVGKRSVVGDPEPYEIEIGKVLHIIDPFFNAATTSINVAVLVLTALGKIL